MGEIKVDEKDIVEYIKAKKVVSWNDLTKTFRMTRQGIDYKLKKYVRIPSLNHNSKYFTLRQFIEEPDENGMWEYQGIKFSIHGRGPETIKFLIDHSEMGLTRKEIDAITGITSKTHLLKFTSRGEVMRLRDSYEFVYFSARESIRMRQIEKREEREGFHGITELEKVEPTREELKEIVDLLELKPGDYFLHRLEMVRRVKSGKSKVQVAKEMDCSPDTVRKACKLFETEGPKGLIIKRKRKPYKLTESVQVEILTEKAKHPDWTPEKIGKVLRERGIDISDATVRNYLKKRGLIGKKKLAPADEK